MRRGLFRPHFSRQIDVRGGDDLGRVQLSRLEDGDKLGVISDLRPPSAYDRARVSLCLTCSGKDGTAEVPQIFGGITRRRDSARLARGGTLAVSCAGIVGAIQKSGAP